MQSSPQVAPGHHAEHFGSLEIQRNAERLGMWLFLGTEVLLFAGLFTAYAVYRSLYPETFREASRHLDVALGTLNTVILLTSSLTVAMSVFYAREGKNKKVLLMIVLSILCGLAFLGIKGLEYAHKFEEGALPGKFYHYAEVKGPAASMFYSLYFLTTGLHGLHVVIGLSVLAWVGVRAWKNEFTPTHHIAVELGGMYWHLVDLVWIFLYPLLYLIR